MSNADWYRFYVPRRLAGQTAASRAADRAAAERDLDAVLGLTGLATADRILEVGCGWGRHALALARRGFGRVVSVDVAPEPLALARALAATEGARCDFRQADFAAVADGPYRAVLSLYDRSCCGYPTETEDRASLTRLAGLIEPGGWLVFGIDDWPRDLPAPGRERRAAPDGAETTEVEVDPAAMTCVHRVTWEGADGRRETRALARQHYAAAEVVDLLDAAGFDLVALRNRLAEAAPFDEAADGRHFFARRRAP